MVSEIIIALVGLFCTVAGSTISHLLTKRKYNTEVDAQQIDNVNRAFDVYKKMTEETLDSQKRLMEATITFQNQTIDTQNQKIAELQKENENLRKQVSELQLQLIKFLGNNFKPETLG